MTAQKRTFNPWFIAGVVTLATFMELLDTSVANVSLQYIGGGLGRSYDEVTWILTTYLVANAVILPMSAWLSRVFGRRNYYLGCVAVFTLTSFFCGIAPTLGFMLGGARSAMHQRWWTRSAGTGNSRRYVSCSKARIGVCAIHSRHSDGARDWSGTGRMDHR